MTFDWLLIVYLLSADVDRRQTAQLHSRPALRETNPLIGEHPDAGRVNRYFVASTLAMVGLAEATPEYRTAILGLSAAVHIACIGRNRKLGLSVEF